MIREEESAIILHRVAKRNKAILFGPISSNDISLKNLTVKSEKRRKRILLIESSSIPVRN
jgi:hypothetical protein